LALVPALSSPGSDFRRRARRAVLPAICAAVWALSWAVSSAQAATTIFEFTGEEQTFRVPGGVHSIHVVAIGGSGGASELLVPGGAAAQVTGDISVTPGNTVYVEVGGRGQDGASGGAGGFNGGATGGAGGGGASDIRTSPFVDGLSPDDRLIVAAGGGGGGGSGPTGMGGNGGAAGENGTTSEGGNEGGGAGTAVLGGFGGVGCGLSGLEGQLGTGGTGGSSEAGSPGGGGGGGYYGGGGGGGGSSLIPVGGSTALASLAATPEVQLTYTLVPPTISIVSPINGATYTKDQVVAASYSCTPPEGTTVEVCEGPVANGAPLDTSTLGAHTFEVEGEDKDGAATEKSVTYTVVSPSTPSGGSGSQTSPPPAPLPDTSLDGHPRETIKTKKKKVKVKFSFSSNVAGASFQCKIDKGKLESCTSPKSYMVKRGRHVFSVQAASSGGTDPIPATFSFKVKKKH
jgi:hypothetical protein